MILCKTWIRHCLVNTYVIFIEFSWDVPEMYSQAPVPPRALETDPYAICNTNPLGVKCTTLKTKLEKCYMIILTHLVYKNHILWLKYLGCVVVWVLFFIEGNFYNRIYKENKGVRDFKLNILIKYKDYICSPLCLLSNWWQPADAINIFQTKRIYLIA